MANDVNRSDISHFAPNDFVIVFGASIQNFKVDKCFRSIAKVIEVGEFDLFLECEKTGTIYKRSKAMCVKLPNHPRKTTPIATPAIGDLVLSYSGSRFSKKEKKLGILIELIDEPPYDLYATILSGEETHKVKFDSLIVMERRQKIE